MSVSNYMSVCNYAQTRPVLTFCATGPAEKWFNGSHSMCTLVSQGSQTSKTSVLGSPKGPDESDPSREVTPIRVCFS